MLCATVMVAPADHNGLYGGQACLLPDKMLDRALEPQGDHHFFFALPLNDHLGYPDVGGQEGQVLESSLETLPWKPAFLGWKSKVRRGPNFDTPHLRTLVMGLKEGAEGTRD